MISKRENTSSHTQQFSLQYGPISRDISRDISLLHLVEDKEIHENGWTGRNKGNIL